MRLRLHRHATTIACAAVLVASWPGWGVRAQTPAAGKKPLSYDAYDYWQSIQGTTLSRDGEWLAYALTSQGADGALVVRNTRTGAEFRHPRGTNPSFTPDAKFVVFTIAQTKAEEERERREAQRNQRGNQRGGGENQAGGGENRRNNPPRTAAGIMALPSGQVSTVE